MEKILVFTDLHITSAGDTIIGLDPVKRLSDALSHALTHHKDAAHVIITGDLTHHGRADQYERLRDILDTCPLPVTLTLGNHDRRAAFQSVFPNAPLSEGFTQSALTLAGHRLIILDTLDEDAPDTHSGFLCQPRLTWLDETLTEARGLPVIVFLHHPPMLTGFDGMDRITLRNREALIERLKHHDAPVQIVAGHIHRTISGHVKGLPVTMFKSPCHQMPMQLGPASSHLSVDEPGAYGLILLTEEGPIIHTVDYALNRQAEVDTHDHS